jgi:hypothetical protein
MNKKRISIFEVSLLVVSIIAFAWMVHTEIGIVSAVDDSPSCAGGADVGSLKCQNNVLYECKAIEPTKSWEGYSYEWKIKENCGAKAQECKDNKCVGSETNDDDDDDKDSKGGSKVGSFLLNAGIGYGTNKFVGGLDKGLNKISKKWFSKGTNTGQALPSTGVGAEASFTPGQAPTLETPKINFGTGELEIGTTAPRIEPYVEGGGEVVVEKAAGSTVKFLETTFWKVASSYLVAAAWAFGTATAITQLSKLFASQRNQQGIKNVAYTSAAGATVAVGTVMMLAKLEVITAPLLSNPIGWVAAVIVVLAVGVYMISGYQVYSRQIYTYTPSLWQAPVGGNSCEKCNDLKINGESICSEYTCKTYGTACVWINDETEYETCTETGEGDGSPAKITPLTEAYEEPVFPNEQYDYDPQGSSGVRIIYEPKENEEISKRWCVPAFTPLTIAVGTDENAQCKISIQSHTSEDGTPEEIFESMSYMGEGSAYTKTHTLYIPTSITLSQGAQNSQGYELKNKGIYQFYIRCRDVRGNINKADYSVGFCVDDGPDLTPPKVIGTFPPEDSYLQEGTETIEGFRVYTNEPAECKWDIQPKNYDYMSNDFEKCPETLINGNDFGCEGTITGLRDEEGNMVVYIACKDQPSLREELRNVGEIYEIKFKGSEELIIQEVTINGKSEGTVIKSSDEPTTINLDVLTSGGAEEGKAICLLGVSGTDEENFALFYNNGERGFLTTNTETLSLSSGDYEYGILCEDVAGNVARETISFSLEIDSTPPKVIRIYKVDELLTILTDEEAKCYYNNEDTGCIYNVEEEGTLMTTSADGLEHTVVWNTETNLHIKCKDKYGIGPRLDKCTMVARPFEIPETIEI